MQTQVISATNAKMPVRPYDRALPYTIIHAREFNNYIQDKKDYGQYKHGLCVKVCLLQKLLWFTVLSDWRRSHKESGMTLVVKCRECGSVFPSMIQIDQLEYGKTTILEDRTETCPKCAKISAYSTKDYWFQS
jgi:hypothetical protein